MDLLDALRGRKKQETKNEKEEQVPAGEYAPEEFTPVEGEQLAKLALSEGVQPIIPAKPRLGLDFFDALRQVADGHRVTKREWGDRDTYGLVQNGLLCLHKGGEPEDVFHAWMISDGDLLGVDFVVLP